MKNGVDQKMNRWHVVKRLLPLLMGMALLLSACGSADLSTLNPQGPIAEEQLDLMKLSITIMIFVVLVVFFLSVYVLIRFRRRPGQTGIPVQVEGNHKLEIIWTAIPILLLIIIGIPTVKSVFGLAKDYSKDANALVVKVTAHQFWWEFEYPKYGIKTSEDLVIPTDKTIQFELTSADVIHSFWIPSLGGKMDTNPGITNKMYLSAPKPGVYKGKCAELCGFSHALMDFKVKAVTPSEFDTWVTQIKAPAAPMTDAALNEVFTKQCLSCHAVDQSKPSPFPNLAGIGDRETIAGILYRDANHTTEDLLKKWIADPQKVKPGTKMPKVDLTEQELEGISKYLAGLKLNK